MANSEKSGAKKNRILDILKWIAGILFFLCIISFIGFKFYTSNYYRADNMIINLLNNISDDEVHAYSDENGSIFIPQREYKSVVVFYPGGKVEYIAYSLLMHKLAERGYICILPKMTENLAIFSVDAVERLGKKHADEFESVEDLDWYIAGHSLGGVAASNFLESDEGGQYAGIILCAAYTTVDFSDSDIRLLSIYGSEDKVMNMSRYEDSKVYWPEDSEEYIIDGGIHSYFGSYGIQDGDGTPSISNDEQLEITADIIDEWIDEKR